MKKKTVAFVPIRLNSKRVVGKNVKLLGNKPLLVYIFEKLLDVPEIDEVYAFCSSEEIKALLPEKVLFLKRDESLDRDETLGAEIYEAFCKAINADVYILAHTTSPFIKATTIQHALSKVLDESYDSAFSAQEIKTFTWYQGKPLNYSLQNIPRTQDLEPVFVETSAFFIFKSEIWKQMKRRIGDNAYLQLVDPLEAVDIDNPGDFEFAEKISESMKVTGK